MAVLYLTANVFLVLFSGLFSVVLVGHFTLDDTLVSYFLAAFWGGLGAKEINTFSLLVSILITAIESQEGLEEAVEGLCSRIKGRFAELAKLRRAW